MDHRFTMTLEQTIDAYLRQSNREDLIAIPMEQKLKYITDQWGRFVRFVVQISAPYYPLVVTVEDNGVTDVRGLPPGWSATVEDITNDTQTVWEA